MTLKTDYMDLYTKLNSTIGRWLVKFNFVVLQLLSRVRLCTHGQHARPPWSFTIWVYAHTHVSWEASCPLPLVSIESSFFCSSIQAQPSLPWVLPASPVGGHSVPPTFARYPHPGREWSLQAREHAPRPSRAGRLLAVLLACRFFVDFTSLLPWTAASFPGWGGLWLDCRKMRSSLPAASEIALVPRHIALGFSSSSSHLFCRPWPQPFSPQYSDGCQLQPW